MCVCVPPGQKSSIEDFRVIVYSGPVDAEGSKSSIGHFRVIVKALQTRKSYPHNCDGNYSLFIVALRFCKLNYFLLRNAVLASRCSLRPPLIATGVDKLRASGGSATIINK